MKEDTNVTNCVRDNILICDVYMYGIHTGTHKYMLCPSPYNNVIFKTISFSIQNESHSIQDILSRSALLLVD